MVVTVLVVILVLVPVPGAGTADEPERNLTQHGNTDAVPPAVLYGKFLTVVSRHNMT